MSGLGPRIPNFLDQIQFIKYYVSNPCEVPYMAYIETALPIAGKIATTLLWLDLFAFVKRLFRPKWVRSWQHTRHGPRKGRLRRGIPEVGEMIADRLDKDGHFRLNHWPMGTFMVVQAMEIIDRVFWTIFVFEMLDGLIINSIIGVIEENAENCPEIASYLARNSLIGGGGAGPTDYPLNVPYVAYNTADLYHTGFVLEVPEGNFVFVFNGFLNGNPGPIECTPRLYITGDGPARYVDGPTFTVREGDNEPFVVSESIKGPAYVQWYIRRGPGFFRVAGANVWLMQIG